MPPSCGDDGMDVEGPQRSDLEPVGTEYHYSDNWVAYVYVCWLGTSNFGTGPVLALFLISRFLMRFGSMLVEVCANIDFSCKEIGESEIVHKYRMHLYQTSCPGKRCTASCLLRYLTYASMDFCTNLRRPI